MKKIIFSFALLLLLGAAAQGQVHMGLKAGANTVGMKLKNFNPNATYQQATSPDRKWGYHGGVFFRVQLANFFVRPEALYTNLRQSFTATQANGADTTGAFDFERIDLPLLVGTSFGPLRVYGGGVYSINLPNSAGALEDQLEDGTVGYQVGAALKLGDFLVEARYEGPITTTARQIVLNNTQFDTDLRVNQFILSVGYELF
ncbi:MAG: outer membrane beta-barrel protein [Schleiferiaceae bacterium]|nr:outer membrane beta-barrel protein [Schleiferiaceae bacterium]